MQAEKIRWGILGTARIASKLVAAMDAAENAEAFAVASRSQQRADEWAKDHGVERAYGSYDDLLADPEVDAIYVPLPPSMHAEWTCRVAEAGKHVLCEKPLAMNGEEARRMVDICREQQVQLMDATMWVHSERAADMKKIITDGKLGEMRRVTSAFGFCLEDYLKANPSYLAASGESGADPGSELRLDRKRGGGCLMDLGWYCIRATLWAFDAMPTKVFGTGRYQHDVDMNFSAILWFDNDRMASFDCGFDVGRRKWFEILGTQGSIVCDDFVQPWEADKARFWIHDELGQPTEHRSATRNQVEAMVAHFSDLVRGGQPDYRWAQETLDTMLVCQALDESARTGEVVGMTM